MVKRRIHFRSAVRIADGYAAKLHYGWQIFSPDLPKNNFNWYAYRMHNVAPWFLIEGRTGLSVGFGPTIKIACETLTTNEPRMMTWCALAANQPAIHTLPLWEDVATGTDRRIWE